MLWGDKLCKAVEGIAGFRPFESQDGEVLFAFMEDTAVPVMENVEYTFGYEDVRAFRTDGQGLHVEAGAFRRECAVSVVYRRRE